MSIATAMTADKESEGTSSKTFQNPSLLCPFRPIRYLPTPNPSRRLRNCVLYGLQIHQQQVSSACSLPLLTFFSFPNCLVHDLSLYFANRVPVNTDQFLYCFDGHFLLQKPLIQFAARYVIRVPGYLKGISSVNVLWQQLH